MNISTPSDERNSQLADRRSFLRRIATGTGAALLSGAAFNAVQTVQAQSTGNDKLDQDLYVLNFALNLEYLEAEYYTRAVSGVGISDAHVGVDGFGAQGVTLIKPGAQVPFVTPIFQQYAVEIAADERAHVTTLRAAIEAAGSTPAAFPRIDLLESFNQAAKLAGIADTFDPFANELNFLVGAFIFEDVGVTAYRGGAPLISNKSYLSTAAGILAVEAYHAALIRTTLFSLGADAQAQAQQISVLRDLVDSHDKNNHKDQGLLDSAGQANIVPTDAHGLVFSRSIRQVISIVCGKFKATQGLFFPAGLNLPTA